MSQYVKEASASVTTQLGKAEFKKSILARLCASSFHFRGNVVPEKILIISIDFKWYIVSSKEKEA